MSLICREETLMVYEIKCNKCGRMFSDAGLLAHTDLGRARSIATQRGWKVGAKVNDYCYCPADNAPRLPDSVEVPVTDRDICPTARVSYDANFKEMTITCHCGMRLTLRLKIDHTDCFKCKRKILLDEAWRAYRMDNLSNGDAL